jgi:hypothetical protein
MRQSHFKKISDRASRRGKQSQAVQENKRLAAALKYGPIRSIESYLVFEITTHNPRTGQRHLLEIRHELRNGKDRYNVYLDGVKWRNQWSRAGFTNWLFGKIESVRDDWGR